LYCLSSPLPILFSRSPNIPSSPPHPIGNRGGDPGNRGRGDGISRRDKRDGRGSRGLRGKITIHMVIFVPFPLSSGLEEGIRAIY